MASGAIIADSLAKGIGLGQNARELTLKRDLLLQEQQKQKIARYGQVLDNGIATMKGTIEQAPDRSDPNYKTLIDTQRDHLMQTAKIIGTIDPQMGQFMEQKINTIHTNTKDMKTANTEKMLAEQQAADAQMDQAVTAKFGAQGTAPTAGAQAPQAPQAPPPGPAMAAPNQQVAQEPQAGLTSQAAAQPPMPAMDVPAPEPTAAPVGQPPVAGPVAGPQTAQAVDPRAAYKQELIERRNEQLYPRTGVQQKMDEFKVKEYGELRTKAFAAEKVARALDRAEELRAQGIFTGTGAEAKLLAYQTADPDNEWVKRTNEYKSIMGSLLGEQLKLFGSATAISNLDLTTVKQYIGQEITMSDESLKGILRLSRIAADEQIELFNRVAQDMGEKGLPAGGGTQSPAAGGQPNYTPDKDGWVTIGRSRIQVQ
jgi:hypothetical protein